MYRSGLVWLLAGVGLTVYATIGILLEDMPGLEQLVSVLENLEGSWVMIAVFTAIVIEGLYFIGSLFPGSSIVVVLAVIATFNNQLYFWFTILFIYAGWVMASVINIYIAHRYQTDLDDACAVKDRTLFTWFPAIRANYEVAQVVSGANPWRVFISSVRVKAWASLFMAGVILLLAKTTDVSVMSNDEGFATLYVSAAIMVAVGAWQVRKSKLDFA